MQKLLENENFINNDDYFEYVAENDILEIINVLTEKTQKEG